MAPHADPDPRDFFEEVIFSKAVEGHGEAGSRRPNNLPSPKETAIDRIWSRLSRQSQRDHIAEEQAGYERHHDEGRDAKTIISFPQGDLENPYNWSSVGVYRLERHIDPLLTRNLLEKEILYPLCRHRLHSKLYPRFLPCRRQHNLPLPRLQHHFPSQARLAHVSLSDWVHLWSLGVRASVRNVRPQDHHAFDLCTVHALYTCLCIGTNMGELSGVQVDRRCQCQQCNRCNRRLVRRRVCRPSGERKGNGILYGSMCTCYHMGA